MGWTYQEWADGHRSTGRAEQGREMVLLQASRKFGAATAERLGELVTAARSWTPDRLAMEVGYGLALANGAQIKPFGRWSREGAAGYRLNVGTQWAMLGADPDQDDPGGFRMVMDFFGEQVANGLLPPERRVGLLGRISF